MYTKYYFLDIINNNLEVLILTLANSMFVAHYTAKSIGLFLLKFFYFAVFAKLIRMLCSGFAVEYYVIHKKIKIRRYDETKECNYPQLSVNIRCHF